MTSFYKVESIPTNSCILLDSKQDAQNYPRGNIDLKHCSNCGFISNMAFDEKLTEYSGRYEETQGFSGTFNKFHHDLADRLIKKHNLNNKTVLEIGCGKGEFITMLSEMGNNKGLGFDPGYRSDHVKGQSSENVEFIKDFYSEKYAEHQADFVCCKMTLEHIHPTSDFISTVRRSIGDKMDTLVFFQIPETLRILKECSFEDIYYEHCSYFTPGSLARLFRKSGFEVLNVETEYDDQYLTIEAIPIADGSSSKPLPAEESLNELQALVDSFPARSKRKIDEWNAKLDQYAKEDKKIVLWGSGSKGVSFLTTLNASEKIDYVVDINPYRQGYFMSGTGQKIVSPDFLAEYQPDVVIVMNAIYTDEISADLKKLNINPLVVPLV
jgi:SAM-dependent methyltransferase